jgi:hypothetical protein
MTEQELQQQRKEKWRLDGRPVRTLDDARQFIESVGFCLLFPLAPGEAKGLPVTIGRPAIVAPTFVGAWAGEEQNLPTLQRAFADPRAQEATDLMVRLLREHSAYEANLFGENSFLVASSIFPYLYALLGDRNPRRQAKPKAGKTAAERGLSPLAQDVFVAIQRKGPVSKPALREVLGGELSGAALDRALNELWSRLKITRVDYNSRNGASWDVLYRWSPGPVEEGAHLSIGESLSALISKYLDCVVAAEPQEIEDFFSLFVPRSRVKEAVNALLTAREFSFVHVGNRTLVQVTPRRTDLRPRQSRRA